MQLLYLRSIPVREAWSLLQVREPEATPQPPPAASGSSPSRLFIALFWAVASNLATRGQQRHRFGTARVLAKFSRVCWMVLYCAPTHPFTSNCPRTLPLSEVVIKKGQAYFQNSSDRLEVHLCERWLWIKLLPRPPSPWSWRLTPHCTGENCNPECLNLK